MTKLLVVDDDAHIRELVKVFLQNEGLEVIEAIDGVDALSKLDTEKVDMVVMDIMMPNMDGGHYVRKYVHSIQIYQSLCLQLKEKPLKKSRAFI